MSGKSLHTCGCRFQPYTTGVLAALARPRIDSGNTWRSLFPTCRSGSQSTEIPTRRHPEAALPGDALERFATSTGHGLLPVGLVVVQSCPLKGRPCAGLSRG